MELEMIYQEKLKASERNLSTNTFHFIKQLYKGFQ